MLMQKQQRAGWTELDSKERSTMPKASRLAGLKQSLRSVEKRLNQIGSEQERLNKQRENVQAAIDKEEIAKLGVKKGQHVRAVPLLSPGDVFHGTVQGVRKSRWATRITVLLRCHINGRETIKALDPDQYEFEKAEKPQRLLANKPKEKKAK